MNEAPDYAEPIKAWRVWKIVREGRDYSLGSMVQQIVWPQELWRSRQGRPRRETNAPPSQETAYDPSTPEPG